MIDSSFRDSAIDTLDHGSTVQLEERRKDSRFLPRYSLRMVKDASAPAEEILMTNPKDAARVVAAYTEGSAQEHLLVILLNTDNVMMGIVHVSSGTINQSLVDPGDVLTPVLTARVPAFILAHNHPSGNPTPSKEDLATFRHIKQAADIMHRNLIDCIVVGDNDRFYSWASSHPYEIARGTGR
jgi:DNA repair protein RadC